MASVALSVRSFHPGVARGDRGKDRHAAGRRATDRKVDLMIFPSRSLRFLSASASAFTRHGRGMTVATFALLSISCTRHQIVKTTASPTMWDRQIRNAVDAGDGDYRLRALRERVAAEPENIAVRIELAKAYRERNYPEIALEISRLAVARFPNPATPNSHWSAISVPSIAAPRPSASSKPSSKRIPPAALNTGRGSASCATRAACGPPANPPTARPSRPHPPTTPSITISATTC